MLTKKHYRDIAIILKTSIEDEKVRAKVVDHMARYFKQDNPRFDRDRFEDACFDMFVEVTNEGASRKRNSKRVGK